jgi:hypothetical protein
VLAGVAIGAACIALASIGGGVARGNTPWNTWGTGTSGHCNIGTGDGYPIYNRYLNYDGVHYTRQCNGVDTTYHTLGYSGASGFAIYRGTGSTSQVCEGGRCGYYWYLSNAGWLPCAWFTYATAC